MPDEKIIRDTVYGYIELSPVDLSIIDTPIFQRLKRIKQLTAFALYPSANQTRFEHSLGVMYLGERVFETLSRNSDLNDIKGLPVMKGKSLEKTVHYACLLHDVGHAAFSHVGEYFYDKDVIWNLIKNESKEIFDAITNSGENLKGSAHEVMSCLVILKDFADILPSEVDLELMCRMITGADFKFNDPRFLLNPIISILNSSFDVDKLDYILRDSSTAGTSNVAIDYDRIVRGYAIRENELMFLRGAIPSIFNLMAGRDYLYQWLYNHHTVVYTDFLIERTLESWFRTRNEQNTLFSYNAIQEGVDDNKIWSLLHRCWREDVGYAWRLFERKFHKSTWKTPYDFKVSVDLLGNNKEKLLSRATDQGREVDKPNIDSFVKTICLKLGKIPGDVFISPRVAKYFNPFENRTIFFWMDNKKVPYGELAGASAFAEGPTEYPSLFYDDQKVEKEDLLSVLNEIL